MSNIKDLSVAQLQRAIAIRQQIENLQEELESLGDGAVVRTGRVGRPPGVKLGRPPGTKGRRRMSAAGRAAIAAAAKARWAKYRGDKAPSAEKPAGKRKRFNSAARAKLSAIAKARWAKVKASGKSAL
jgi:hypothetical protein